MRQDQRICMLLHQLKRAELHQRKGGEYFPKVGGHGRNGIMGWIEPMVCLSTLRNQAHEFIIGKFRMECIAL